MATFAQSITSLNIPHVERPFTPRRIWWRNGVKAAKTPGFFYTNETEFPAQPSPEFIADDTYEGESGWRAETLHLAFIAWRTQPFERIETDDGVRYIWHTEWRPGMQLYTEVLAFMQGYDEPIVWASKGMTGAAITGRNGILRRYESTILRAGEKIANRALPFFTFWAPISTLQRDGRPVYQDTGHGSFITPPALAYPEDVPIDQLIEQYYIDEEYMRLALQWAQRLAGWSQQRRSNEVVASATQIAANPAVQALAAHALAAPTVIIDQDVPEL